MIDKEQWADLESKLASYLVGVELQYKGHKLNIKRERDGESKTVLAVYIDGIIKGSWFLPDADDRPAIVSDVWRKRSKRVYSHHQKAKIIKQFGKRQAMRVFPDIDKAIEFYDPYFNTSKTLIHQFKKLDGLELISSEAF